MVSRNKYLHVQYRNNFSSICNVWLVEYANTKSLDMEGDKKEEREKITRKVKKCTYKNTKWLKVKW
jgi:hypothetical protein